MELKILSLFLVALLLPSAIHSQVVNVECSFRFGGPNYDCFVDGASIPNDLNINVLFFGVHQPGYNNQMVTRIFIERSNVSFVIKDTFKTFPALRSYIVFSSVSNSGMMIQENALQDAYNLQEFVIIDSNLHTIAASAFQGTTNLRYIVFSRNQLRSVPAGLLDGLINLELIMLNFNKLTALPSSFFQPAVSLTQIHIGNNEFRHLPANLISGNSRLNEFYAPENQIDSIGRGFLDNLNAISNINLLGNVCVSINFNGIGSNITIEQVNQQLEPCY